MSTRFTSKGLPLVESHSLQLIQSSSKLTDVMTKYVAQRLVDKGYTSITPSLLSFLSVLECGVNFGSEIARSLGVTRQMVAKTVKELSRLGYLEQREGSGKQKEIVFTEKGEGLMSDSRQLLSELDEIVFKGLGDRTPLDIIGELSLITSKIEESRQS